MTFEATKDPQEVVDYQIDWSATLNASSPIDTITTSSWAASSGLVVDSNTNTTTTARVWVSAGTVNTYAELTNTVVTDAGRTYERTIIVKVQPR